jgi:hypothetical protein
MHKTHLLVGLDKIIFENSQKALAQFGIYAAAASTSWGPALYQPQFDQPGTTITEEDPTTGAIVTVTQLPRNPHITFKYDVQVPDVGKITGKEEITGTKIGLRGLGMPAPSRYIFENSDSSYRAEGIGVIHSELAPGLGRWKIRGFGDLQLSDNQGNQGSLTINRRGNIFIEIGNSITEQIFEHTFNFS